MQEVKVSCVDYITAGVDTVGNSLIYAIWLISSNDSVQKRLREELESIGKPLKFFHKYTIQIVSMIQCKDHCFWMAYLDLK